MMNPLSPHASSRIAGALAATLLVIPAAAIAQTLPATEPPAPSALPPSPLLKLTTQEEYVIREVLLTDANIPKESSAPDAIGDSVPENIELRTLPPEVVKKVPKAQGHKYFIKGDAVFLVSPSDRRIALVLQKKPTD